MEKIQSKRDREMLVNDGYMYIFDKFSADKQKKFWRCRQKNDCLARIHTSIDNLTILKKSENLHTHGSDAAKVETQIAITNIKKRALSTMEQTSCVINECTSSLSQAAKVLKKKLYNITIQVDSFIIKYSLFRQILTSFFFKIFFIFLHFYTRVFFQITMH